MPHYRYHILDQRGDLKGAVDVDCADDEEAIKRFGAAFDGGCGELWRLVTRYKLDGPSIELKPP